MQKNKIKYEKNSIIKFNGAFKKLFRVKKTTKKNFRSKF